MEAPSLGWEGAADLGWGSQPLEDGNAENLRQQRSGSRARTHSFYEDDEDLSADMEAAVSGIARPSPPRAQSRGRSDSMEGGGEGGAQRGPRAGALNANEMAALNAGLHSYPLGGAVARREHSNSSDIDEDGEPEEELDSPNDFDSEDGRGDESTELSPTPPRSPAYPASASRPSNAYPPFASNPGVQGRPGIGEYRDSFPGSAVDDSIVRPPPVPGQQPPQQQQQSIGGSVPRVNIPRPIPGGMGGFSAATFGSSGGYGHVRRSSPSNARKIKILMLGDTGVGKSSLINRFTEDTFNPSLVGTVGVDFKMKHVNLDGEDVLLQVWDTAGQERFHKITRAYYRGSHAIVIVYDLSNPSTLENIEYWMRNIQENAGQTVKTCLVGNKMDLRDELVGPDGDDDAAGGYDDMVAPDDGRRIADQFGIQFYEASAKTGIGVSDAYLSVARAANEFLRQAVKPATPVKGGSRKLSVGRGRSKAKAAAAAKKASPAPIKDRSRDRTSSGDTSDTGSASAVFASGHGSVGGGNGLELGDAAAAGGGAAAAGRGAAAPAAAGALSASGSSKRKEGKKNGCKVS